MLSTKPPFKHHDHHRHTTNFQHNQHISPAPNAHCLQSTPSNISDPCRSQSESCSSRQRPTSTFQSLQRKNKVPGDRIEFSAMSLRDDHGANLNNRPSASSPTNSMADLAEVLPEMPRRTPRTGKTFIPILWILMAGNVQDFLYS